MLSIQVTYNESEVAEIDGYFRDLTTRITDFTPYLLEAAAILRKSFSTTFEAQGRPRWAALSPRYLAWKVRHGYPAAIGRLTGAMRESLISQGGGAHIEEISSTQLIIGTSVFYAGFFHGGTKKMPARPLFQIYPEDIKELIDNLRLYISKVEGP